MCDLAFTFVSILFWDGCNKLWSEILVVQAMNRSGRLKVEVRVLLCFVYFFCDVYVLACNLVRLAIMAIAFSDFRIWG